MARRAAISQTGAGTQVIVAAVAGKSVRVRRLFMCASGAATADFQDTGGNSLVGAPLTIAAATQFFLNYADEADARNNPMFITPVGTGFQLVLSANNAFGFVDFDQQ